MIKNLSSNGRLTLHPTFSSRLTTRTRPRVHSSSDHNDDHEDIDDVDDEDYEDGDSDVDEDEYDYDGDNGDNLLPGRDHEYVQCLVMMIRMRMKRILKILKMMMTMMVSLTMMMMKLFHLEVPSVWQTTKEFDGILSGIDVIFLLFKS